MPSPEEPQQPTFYNHAHFPVPDYTLHNPKKFHETEEFGGLHSARVLACTSPEDVVQLDPRLKDAYPYIVEHLASVGLKTAGEIIFDTDPAVANRYPDYPLSVYAFNSIFHALRPDARRLAATESANNKNSFMRYCADLSLPIPPTYVSSRGPVYPREAVGLPAYIKAARSSAGVSIYRADNEATLAEALGRIGDSEYQIQAEVPGAVAFLNVQYRTTPEGVEHLATTEQLLNGFTHIGNTYPSIYGIRHITDGLAGALRADGLRGIFAFDGAVTLTRKFLIECNARWNGSTYPTMVFRRLGALGWTARTLDTRFERPQDLKLNGILYDPATRSGVVITNFGMLESQQKLNCLVAGDTKEEQNELFERLTERLQGTPTRPPVLRETTAPSLV